MERSISLINATEESKARALRVAQVCTQVLKEEFGATRVILFGSLAGLAPWHDRSDIDLAVEGLAGEDFFRAYSACCDLLPQGLALDLVPLERVYPEMRSRILQEVEMPSDPILSLKSLVEDELISLERLVRTTQDALRTVSEHSSQLELNGFAAYLQQF